MKKISKLLATTSVLALMAVPVEASKGGDSSTDTKSGVMAALKKKVSKVKRVVREKISSRDPAFLAIQAGDESRVKQLITAPNVNKKDEQNYTYLSSAVYELTEPNNAQNAKLKGKLIKIIQYILSIPVSDPYIKAESIPDKGNGGNRNSLHLAVAFCEPSDLNQFIDLILAKPETKDHINDDADLGGAVLALAAEKGKASAVNKIINAGANVKCVDSDGETAAHKASWYAPASAKDQILGLLFKKDATLKDVKSKNGLSYLDPAPAAPAAPDGD